MDSNRNSDAKGKIMPDLEELILWMIDYRASGALQSLDDLEKFNNIIRVLENYRRQQQQGLSTVPEGLAHDESV